MRFASALLFLAAVPAAFAQDVLRVSSPDGKIDAAFGVALPPVPGAFVRIAYQVAYNGKPLLERSYLGFWLHDQEPILGQNTGLTQSSTSQGPGYNAATGEFLQNGSIGRRITLEMRVFNEGLAFRYHLPRSAALEDLYVDTEETEFHLAQNGDVQFADGHKIPLNKLKDLVPLPLKVEQPGIGWVTLTEARVGDYPRVSLEPKEATLLGTRLESPKNALPIAGHTPITSSWRVILVGPTPLDPGVAAKYLR
jgi:alpha-glucosidase